MFFSSCWFALGIYYHYRSEFATQTPAFSTQKPGSSCRRTAGFGASSVSSHLSGLCPLLLQRLIQDHILHLYGVRLLSRHILSQTVPFIKERSNFISQVVPSFPFWYQVRSGINSVYKASPLVIVLILFHPRGLVQNIKSLSKIFRQCSLFHNLHHQYIGRSGKAPKV